MHIRLMADDEAAIREARTELAGLLEKDGLGDAWEVTALKAEKPTGAQKGDPVTVWTVLLAAVGAGGALTVAMSKEGFLTRLARVLEKLADRQVSVTLEETPKGGRSVSLSGSARHVERVLTEYMGQSSESPKDPL